MLIFSKIFFCHVLSQFIKNELVPSKDLEEYLDFYKWENINPVKYDRIKYYQDPKYHGGHSYQDTYLFKSSEENRLYYTTNNYLERCGAVEEEEYKALSFLENKGGKYYNEDEALWVEVNGAKCMFTPIIKEGLANKDITVINKMYKSVNQHKVYKGQASDLAIRMAKYMNKYDSGLITSQDISHWEKITKQCSNLLDKMRNLPYADNREYYEQIREEDKEGKKLVDIIDFHNASKIILGL